MKQLHDDDSLAKYIFKTKDIRSDGSPRPASLKPKDGEMLSMTEITGMQHSEVCIHGHEHVDNPDKGRIHIGYVKFLHKSFIKLNLETIYDDVPPRHVSVNFPDEPEKRRELTKALADEALVIDEQSEKKYFAACE
ncbi:MAG: hypothetical protein L0Z73_01475 [Gammaproteobacteria bacterium]|nr:hypothetical protein [Gammaproteobacteria bacterium]